MDAHGLHESEAALEALMDQIPLAEQMGRRIEPLTDFWAHTASVRDYLWHHGVKEQGLSKPNAPS